MSSPEDLEQVVLNLAREYLARKVFFSIEEIVVFINNRVRTKANLNKAKIEMIIKSLIKKNIILPGTKLVKDSIVENTTRKEILNLIAKSPSININEIMREQKIGSNQALWHLSCLEKFQFIRSKKIENRTIFFQYDSDQALDDFFYYLKLEIVQFIIDFIQRNNCPLKLMDIADGLNKNHNTVKKYLDALCNLELLQVQKENTRNTYTLNQDLYKKVMKNVYN